MGWWCWMIDRHLPGRRPLARAGARATEMVRAGWSARAAGWIGPTRQRRWNPTSVHLDSWLVTDDGEISVRENAGPSIPMVCMWTTGGDEHGVGVVRCGAPTTHRCDFGYETCDLHRSSCCTRKPDAPACPTNDIPTTGDGVSGDAGVDAGMNAGTDEGTIDPAPVSLPDDVEYAIWILWKVEGDRPIVVAIDTSRERADQHVLVVAEEARVRGAPRPEMFVEESRANHLYGESIADLSSFKIRSITARIMARIRARGEE